MRQITQGHSPIQIAALQVAIVVCTLTVAFMHLFAGLQPIEDFRFWFLFNGLIYLGLLTAFFMPHFRAKHHLISFLLMGYALLTIVLWFLLGQPDELISCITNAVELVLVVFAFYEGYRALRFHSVPFI